MISEYVNKLQSELVTGNALEHSYRPAFKNLIESLNPSITAINEPSRTAFGNPDFIFLKKGHTNIIMGYAETKDLDVKLNDVEKSAQLKRYFGYSNLILTNYIEFRFYRNGEKYQTIEIAKKESTFLRIIPQNLSLLEGELKAFLEGKPERITNGKRLAQIMGGKALRIRENVKQYLNTQNEKNKELEKLYSVMKELLVHDLTVEKFADMYSQTIVYGLFVARYHDKTPQDFNRKEARDLVPPSNPFLQHFFDHLVGPNFDVRLGYIVDELCEIFTVTDIQEIIRQHFNLFGEAVDKDPIIHFYEDFLKEYDTDLRKSMGAYYTPVPIVQFIIRAVDDVLKNEFNINGGLTSTDKIQRDSILQGKKVKETMHRIQILDPAVGTATFLNEIIKHIYKGFSGQEGVWESYIDKELLPRLYGFELMMAPYTIAHLKLTMTLKETGIERFNRRLGVYLTNTLEEGIKQKHDLFSFGFLEAISEESKAADTVKHDKPIMVIIGNPPYKGISSNETQYANNLIQQYKVEPGGKQKLQERKHWLNDDYVKFIAFAEQMISKNGEGVVAMITNHGYLDNPTFRGMRWHLTKTFNKIYVLDLHGNIKKKEFNPAGGIDENVFDIQQGVAIIIAIKQKINTRIAEIFRADVWGKRENKLDFLLKSNLNNIEWKNIEIDRKLYSFTYNTDSKPKIEYEKGIMLTELFPTYVSGIVTARDQLVIDINKEQLKYRMSLFFDSSRTDDQIRRDFFPNKKTGKYLPGDSRGWKLNKARAQLMNENHENNIQNIAYRPFDTRWIYYHQHMVDWGRQQLMKNFSLRKNFSFSIHKREELSVDWSHIFCINIMSEHGLTSSKTTNYQVPLYIYFDDKQTTLSHNSIRKSNLNTEKVQKILKNLGDYQWIDDHENKKNASEISPLDIFDYVYAVLYSPKYRKEYKDFLKTDFPRVPPTKNKEQFYKLIDLGGKLRKLHLMEDPELNTSITTFPIKGENTVENIKYDGEKVWINTTQYFGGVPKDSWEFYIGGYQPAQKWLKDRKGRTLTYEDITHYQKIIKAQSETIKIMNEIDVVGVV